jgi:hypothetical protein
MQTLDTTEYWASIISPVVTVETSSSREREEEEKKRE